MNLLPFAGCRVEYGSVIMGFLGEVACIYIFLFLLIIRFNYSHLFSSQVSGNCRDIPCPFEIMNYVLYFLNMHVRVNSLVPKNLWLSTILLFPRSFSFLLFHSFSFPFISFPFPRSLFPCSLFSCSPVPPFPPAECPFPIPLFFFLRIPRPFLRYPIAPFPFFLFSTSFPFPLVFANPFFIGSSFIIIPPQPTPLLPSEHTRYPLPPFSLCPS